MLKAVLCFVILSTVGLSACSVIPKAPDAKPPVDRPSVEMSTLEVKVAAPYTVIARELNRAIPNQLHWATGQPAQEEKGQVPNHELLSRKKSASTPNTHLLILNSRLDPSYLTSYSFDPSYSSFIVSPRVPR